MSEHGVSGRGELVPGRERSRAANAVVPLLREALRGRHPRRALAAVAAAGPAAVPALALALREGDGPVRRAATLALGHMPPHALPVAADLAAALGDGDAGVRWAAARALGALGPRATRALRQLFKALGDPDARVSWAAAEALANIGPQAGATHPGSIGPGAAPPPARAGRPPRPCAPPDRPLGLRRRKAAVLLPAVGRAAVSGRRPVGALARAGRPARELRHPDRDGERGGAAGAGPHAGDPARAALGGAA